MKVSRFTEEQIAFAIKQSELGTKVDEICRKMGISDATFYKWRQKYAGLGPSELKKLKQLEEENSKLKRLVADLSQYFFYRAYSPHAKRRRPIIPIYP